jgi:hypothetical protein
MKKAISWFSAALAAAGVFSVSGFAAASSHREAPIIANDPVADSTDLWAWVKPGTHEVLYVVASYIPMEEPAGGPNFYKFSDEVLYEVHIARGNGPLTDAVTYQITFKTDPVAVVANTPQTGLGGGHEFFAQLSAKAGGGWPKQTYTVTKIVAGQAPVVIGTGLEVAPPNVGPRTDTVLLGQGKVYDDAYAATFIKTLNAGEGRTWVGPRDDGFYVDLGAVFDLANLRFSKSPLGNNPAVDNVAGYNVHTIALEIPTGKVSSNGNIPTGASDENTVGVWTSASRRQTRVLQANGQSYSYGAWTQVSRLGVPLVNEALIGLQDKDKYSRTKPIDDVANFASYFLSPVVVRDAEAVGVYTAYGVPAATVTTLKENRTDILDAINIKNVPTMGAHAIPIEPGRTGDVLRVDLGIDSGFPNGRPISGGPSANQEPADVTDVLLTVILTAGTVPPGCGGPSQLPGQSKVGDCADSNDKPFLTSFPFLALPWAGYSGGHGKVTNP